MAQRAILQVIAGPHAGDTLSVDIGTCRLIGRHLAEAETAFIDRNGNRVLEGSAAQILTDHLHDKTPEVGTTTQREFSGQSFERGPDIIFTDDSISRAHAMVFYDDTGFGVIDLASTNGTFVDDERISSALVKGGRQISIGNSDLKVTFE
jgi:hypothetical protein